MKGGERDVWEYARCIDCAYFGQHGAYCDIQSRQELCSSKACVFFQWKRENTLRHMDPVYFSRILKTTERKWNCVGWNRAATTDRLIAGKPQEWLFYLGGGADGDGKGHCKSNMGLHRAKA